MLRNPRWLKPLHCSTGLADTLPRVYRPRCIIGMGVHGLTTYLRESKHLLSRTVQIIQSGRRLDLQRIPVVIDAWSSVHDLHMSMPSMLINVHCPDSYMKLSTAQISPGSMAASTPSSLGWSSRLSVPG